MTWLVYGIIGFTFLCGCTALAIVWAGSGDNPDDCNGSDQRSPSSR